MLYCNRKRGVSGYEKSSLHCQQYHFIVVLSFNLMDDICRRVVLFDGTRLEIEQSRIPYVVFGYRIDLSNPRFLRFGNHPVNPALAKRTLPRCFPDTIFTACNPYRIDTFVPFACLVKPLKLIDTTHGRPLVARFYALMIAHFVEDDILGIPQQTNFTKEQRMRKAHSLSFFFIRSPRFVLPCKGLRSHRGAFVPKPAFGQFLLR